MNDADALCADDLRNFADRLARESLRELVDELSREVGLLDSPSATAAAQDEFARYAA
jgi:hypothetical protein